MTLHRPKDGVFPNARWAVLRLLSSDGVWEPWTALAHVLEDAGQASPDILEWYVVSRRECVALGEIETRAVEHNLEVRLTEKGKQARAVEDATAVHAPAPEVQS